MKMSQIVDLIALSFFSFQFKRADFIQHMMEHGKEAEQQLTFEVHTVNPWIMHVVHVLSYAHSRYFVVSFLQRTKKRLPIARL